MLKQSLIAAVLLLGCSPDTRAQNIYTIAGTSVQGFSGDGGPALSAKLDGPGAMQFSKTGELIFSDKYNSVVRKIDLNGNISTIAGTPGVSGSGGDGGPATSAKLGTPFGLAIDKTGNIFIADFGNSRIRKIDAGGIISTVVGTGAAGNSGDGGPANLAEIGLPSGLAIDTAGNLYISDVEFHVVRKVNSSGVISTIAGVGVPDFIGDGGPAIHAALNNPLGIFIDSSGVLYIVDNNNGRIRKVDVSGNISTFAGTGTFGFSGDGGPATSAELNSPVSIAKFGSDFYIADPANYRIRKVSSSGTISTIAGTGTSGYSGDGGDATLAQFNFANHIIFDRFGNLYIADWFNQVIREIRYNTTSINETHKANVQIAGNIVRSQIQLTQISTQSRYSLFNTVGQLVKTDEITTRSASIDVSTLPPGLYLLKVYAGADNSEELFKIIKR